VQNNGFTLTPLNWHINVFGFDGKCIVLKHITDIVALKLQYLKHKKLIKLFVTTLGHLMIFGQSWMKLHKVVIDWNNLKFLFTASHCKQKCFVTRCSDPKQKSEKSTRFHQPKNSTEFH